jgi:ATP synthase protein I
MSDNARGTGPSDDRSKEEAAFSARLRQLGDKLDRNRPGAPPEPTGARRTADASALARGLRLSSELVAGVVVGGVIGWALDYWLGISPWGMIVFLLLGFAAGVLNVMRSAGVVAERDWRTRK